MRRAAKSFFFSFLQVLCFGLGQCHPHVSYYFTRLPSKHQPCRPFDVWAEPALPRGEASLLRIKRGVKLRWSPGLAHLTCSPSCTRAGTTGSRRESAKTIAAWPRPLWWEGTRGPEGGKGLPQAAHKIGEMPPLRYCPDSGGGQEGDFSCD